VSQVKIKIAKLIKGEGLFGGIKFGRGNDFGHPR
jgi:hypothetical protein